MQPDWPRLGSVRRRRTERRVVAIFETRVAGPVLPRLREVATVVTELGGVRAGHIRHGGARPQVVEIPRLRRTADAVRPRSRGHAEKGRGIVDLRHQIVCADGRAEFDDAWNIGIRRVIAMLREVVQLPVHRQAGFEQNDAGQRIRPARLHQPGGMHLSGPPAVSRHPRRHRAVTRILAGQPLIPEEVELVPSGWPGAVRRTFALRVMFINCSGPDDRSAW